MIINALDVSADMVLADVINRGYIVKHSILAEKLDNLSAEERSKIYDVIEAMLKYSTNVKP